MSAEQPNVTFGQIDARCYRRAENTNERAQVVDDFLAAMNDQSFCEIADEETFPGPALRPIREAADWLFEFSDRTLDAFSRPDVNREVGFCPFGVEHARGEDVYNACRYWHVRLNQLLPEFNSFREKYRKAGRLWENVWPIVGDPAGELKFLQAYQGFAPRYLKIALFACELLEVGMDLEPQTLQRMVLEGENVSRLLHYPAKVKWQEYLERLGDPDRKLQRNIAHVDSGAVTVLPYSWGSAAGGFQVQLADGTWVPAKVSPGVLLVNLGALFEFITQGKFRAVPHRVVNATDPRAERFVVTGFFQFAGYQKLTPICEGPGELSFPWNLEKHPFGEIDASVFKGVFLDDNYSDDRLKGD